MWCILAVAAFACFLPGNTEAAEEPYQSLGCFKDTSDRAIPTLEGQDPLLDGDYQQRQNATEKCYQAALTRGFEVFAIQNGGWCASGPTAKQTYNKYGQSSECGADGEGGPWANAVYEIEDEEPPRIVNFIQHDLVNPEDVTVTTGLNLPCGATGGNLKFAWKVNGAYTYELGIGNHIYTIHDDGTLTKNNAEGGDGTYQCFVSNSKGTTFSRKVKVKVTEIDVFKDTDDETIDVTLGKPLTLICPPREQKGFGVEFDWQKSVNKIPSVLPQDERRAITPEGNLHMMYLTQEDIDIIHGADGIKCRMSAAGSYADSHNINIREVGQEETGNIKTTFYLKPLENDFAIAGQEKTIFCIATGRPVPVITWKLNGTEIISEDQLDDKLKSFQIVNKRTLILMNIKKDVHEGTYDCEAKAAGGDKIQAFTQLTVKVPTYWTTGKKPKHEIKIAIQGNGTLKCDASGDPAPVYTWYKNGVLVQSNKHIKTDGDTIRFYNVRLDEGGVYQCVAENEVGMIAGSTWVYVEGKKPNFKSFGLMYLFRNSTSILKCEPDAAPAPTAVWTRKGKVIKSEGRYQLKDDGRILVIKNVSDEDKGEYTCNATNEVGSDTATGTAKILDRTEIIVAPLNVYMVEGKPFDLRCEAKADRSLELSYKWWKDGVPLRYSSRVVWSEGSGTLTVFYARSEDAGEYVCIAYTPEPKKSEDRKSAIVSIRGTPNPPSGLAITDCFDLSTELQWIHGDPNNASSTHYIVEQEDVSKPNVFVFHTNVNQPNATKVNLTLTPWAVLRFRMRAVNSLGTSRPSKPTTTLCKTKEQAPDKYPDHLRGEFKKARELDITWNPLTRLEQNAPGCHYILKYRKQRVAEWIIVTITDVTVGRFPVPNPGYYELWEFKIQAINDVAPGPVSNIVTSRSGQDAPKDKPINVKKDDVTARSIDLSWDRVTVTRGNVDGYRIYYWSDGQAVRRKRREIGANANSTDVKGTDDARQKTTVRGLKPFTSYRLSIVAFNSGGEGPESEEIAFYTQEDVPGPPSDVKVYTFGEHILVTWAPPVEQNGIITGYELGAVKYQNIQNMPKIVHDISKGPNEFRALLSNLEYKSKYVVEIAAKTKIGPGPAVRTLDSTIDKSAPATPRAPIVESIVSKSVNVKFLFGLKKGGYPKHFKVLYREKSENETWRQTEWINHLNTQWVKIASLNDALHEFKTVGKNDVGESLESTTTDGRPLPGILISQVYIKPIYQSAWFIVLMVVIVLVFLFFLVLVLLNRRGRATYPVRKMEQGRVAILENQPDEKEVFPRNEEIPPNYQSQGSLQKSNPSDSDRDSLDDYGEGPEFKEDGSFTREYGDDKDGTKMPLYVTDPSTFTTDV